MSVQLLTEQLDNVQLEILESRSNGSLRVRGEFGRYDKPTDNGRFYQRPIWEGQIQRLSPRFENRRVFGELDHPEDGKTKLRRVSHIVTDLQLSPDGRLIGEAEILPTDSGRNLAVLIKHNCKVGVSSRGYGSVKRDAKGRDVVQEDYKLVTFDFVADPADKTAVPDVVSEETTSEGAFLFEGLTMDDAEELISEEDGMSVREKKRAEIADKLLGKLSEFRTEIEESVRAGDDARRDDVLDEIVERLRPHLLPEDTQEEVAQLRFALREREERIADLEEEVEVLADTAKATGFQCYLERQLSGDPNADTVRRLVGDVRQYANAEEFKAKVEDVREELQLREQLAEEREREREREREVRLERVMREKQAADAKTAELKEALAKAVEALHEVQVQSYAEERLTRQPQRNRRELREMLREGYAESTEDVDRMIEAFRPRERSVEEVREATSRVREQFGGGRSHLPIEEEEPWPRRRGSRGRGEAAPGSRLSEELGALGVSLDELAPLMPRVD